MATVTEQKQTTDSSVFALISAFISGQDIFKKLKERKQRRKLRKEEKEAAVQQEARLSISLNRGPQDIQSTYEQNFALHGQTFRQGDAQAHASLAATLLKLNNGLVSIISQFLGNGKKTKSLDYDALTILSETSRVETIDALSSLAYRLSHFKLLNFMRPSSKRKEHDKQPRRKSSGKKSSPTRNDASKQLPIRQVQSSNVSSPQLALVRPRPKPNRTASAGSGHGTRRPSGSHHRSQSAIALDTFPAPTFASPPRKAANSSLTPPITPRTSLQTPRDPRQPNNSMKSRVARSTPNLLSFSSRRPVAPTPLAAAPPTPPDSPRPNITTPSHFDTHLLSPQLPPNPHPTPTASSSISTTPHQQRTSTTTRPISTASSNYRHHLRPSSATAHFPRRRRTQKSVASMQTFSTGSTKLGEIPQHKLVQPFDYAEMARMNASAAMVGGLSAGQQGDAVALAGAGPGSGGAAMGVDGGKSAGFWGGLFGRNRGRKKQRGSGVVVG